VLFFDLIAKRAIVSFRRSVAGSSSSAWRSPRPRSRPAAVEVAAAEAVGELAAADRVVAAPAAVGRAEAAQAEAERAGAALAAAGLAAERAGAARGSIAPSKSSLGRRSRQTSRPACRAWSGTRSIASASSGTAACCPTPISPNTPSLAKADRYQDAIDVLDLLDNPNTPRALNYRGYATRKLGRTEEGISYYLKSVALDPNYPQVREYLGEAYIIEGKYDLAKDQLETIEKLCGSECEYYEDLANALTQARAL
jgi:tetratricopeptide (TPR) repeat protein